MTSLYNQSVRSQSIGEESDVSKVVSDRHPIGRCDVTAARARGLTCSSTTDTDESLIGDDAMGTIKISDILT